uniref:Integrase core domain containing protein n=1 Tax=Solanum tuberosum TaxID=4113 RepID=M1DNH3_SOLTU
MRGMRIWLMIRRGVSEPTPKVPTQIIGVKVMKTKVGTMENYNRDGNYVRDGNYNADNNDNQNKIGNRNKKGKKDESTEIKLKRWCTGPIDGPSVNPQTGDDIRRSQVQWHQTKHPCTPGRKIPTVFPHPNDDSMILVGTNMSRKPQKAPPLSSIPRITRMGRSSHLVTRSRSRSLIQSEEGETLGGESQSDYKSHSGSSSSGTSASSSDATSTGDV